MAAGYENCCLPCVLSQNTTKLCLDISAPGCDFDGAHVVLKPVQHALCALLRWRGNNNPGGIVVGTDCYVYAEVYCGPSPDGAWGVTWSAGLFAFSEDPVSVSVQCDPFQIVFSYGTISVPAGCCSSTTTTVTLTFTACGDFWCGDDVADIADGGGGGGEGLMQAKPPALPPASAPTASRVLGAAIAKRNSAPKPRPAPCIHLGGRLERKQGCGGFSCTHDCDHGVEDTGHAAVERHLGGRHPLKTVPSDQCQTCPGYERDPHRAWA